MLTQGDFVDRWTAMAVPAYRRAVTLCVSNLSMLKFVETVNSGDGKPVRRQANSFLRQPDNARTMHALIGDTVADLCHFGVAYWVNFDYAAPDGWRYATGAQPKHSNIKYVPAENVSVVRKDFTDLHPEYVIRWNGEIHHVPAYAVIAFETPAGNWLRDGARTITTGRMLEDAVRLYAQTPQPLQVIKNDGPKKTPEQIEALLDAFERARREHSVAYAGRDISLESSGFDAEQIALTKARDHAVLDIARLTGIPVLYLSQGITGTSHNYSNLTQQRLDLMSAIVPFADAIAERLSFDDVTGAGVSVEFDFGPFLRVDPHMRAALYKELVPLGIIEVEEARAFEALAGYIPLDTAPTGDHEADTPTNTPGMGGLYR